MMVHNFECYWKLIKDSFDNWIVFEKLIQSLNLCTIEILIFSEEII